MKEGFAGITSHAMLFAPITGIAAIYLFAKGIYSKKSYYVVLAAACVLVVFTTLSRSAISATICGIFGIVVINSTSERFTKMIRLVMPVILIFCVFISFKSEESTVIGFGEKNALAIKGKTVSSRKNLWEGRLVEFYDNPVLGLGVGQSKGYGTFYDQSAGKFAATVEPGSAYLVVLSMTGLMGAITLVIALGAELLALFKVWAYVPKRRKFELAGIGLFLFVHAVAEGWIYSPGIITCLFFWLWFGMVGDSVYEAVYGNNRGLIPS